jgi:DnaJ-class molecular chaperone
MPTGRIVIDCPGCEDSMDVPDNAFGRRVHTAFALEHKDHVEDCPQCGGNGELWDMAFDGRETLWGTCDRCGGKGVVKR